MFLFLSQAEDGIRGLVRSRGLGDVYKRQVMGFGKKVDIKLNGQRIEVRDYGRGIPLGKVLDCCLLYTSDAADERSSVDLGGSRIIKQKTHIHGRHLRTSAERTMRTTSHT